MTIPIKATAAALMLSLSAATAYAETPRPITVGYVPAFKGMGAIMTKSDLTPYTHLNISFANPDASGAILSGDVFSCMQDETGAAVPQAALHEAVARAHKSGSKILVSLGGGSIPQCSGNWAELLKPENRATVVKNLVALADTFGLDGIDVDIEGVLLTEIDKAGNYTPFIAELSAALKARGKLLTCATASYVGGMIPDSSIPYFDLVNVMAYDAIGPNWGTAGDEHSPYSQAERDMKLWRAKGVAKDKLVLGVPFYGYGYGDYAVGYNAYRDLVATFGAEIADKDVYGKRCAGCSYVTYNGLPTLRKKAKLAMKQGAGVMVWEISQDTDDQVLIRTLTEALKP